MGARGAARTVARAHAATNRIGMPREARLQLGNEGILFASSVLRTGECLLEHSNLPARVRAGHVRTPAARQLLRRGARTLTRSRSSRSGAPSASTIAAMTAPLSLKTSEGSRTNSRVTSPFRVARGGAAVWGDVRGDGVCQRRDAAAAAAQR